MTTIDQCIYHHISITLRTVQSPNSTIKTAADENAQFTRNSELEYG